jgi:hypothetical protein
MKQPEPDASVENKTQPPIWHKGVSFYVFQIYGKVDPDGFWGLNYQGGRFRPAAKRGF